MVELNSDLVLNNSAVGHVDLDNALEWVKTLI